MTTRQLDRREVAHFLADVEPMERLRIGLHARIIEKSWAKLAAAIAAHSYEATSALNHDIQESWTRLRAVTRKRRYDQTIGRMDPVEVSAVIVEMVESGSWQAESARGVA